MKVLIFASCIIALASASLPHLHSVSAGGLPLDTPEVAAAKIQHYHDFAVAAQRNGVAAGYAAYPAYSYAAYPAYGYAAAYSYPVIGADGQPLETPEVQAAKASHFAAHAEAKARTGALTPAPVHYGSYYYGGAVIGANGQPLETPEVQAAKAGHFAAHAEARARSAAAGAAIGADGHPLETPEVQAAKASHFAAHIEAKARSGALVAAPVYSGYYGHIPAIVNGVPVETPEVQAAKAKHLAAHVEANVRSGVAAPLAVYGASYGYGYHVPAIVNGVPVETPEVQLAKAGHFAAHAAAAQRAALAPAEQWQW